MTIVEISDAAAACAFASVLLACGLDSEEPQQPDDANGAEPSPAVIGEELVEPRPMMQPVPPPPPNAVVTDGGVKLAVLQPGTAASYHPDGASSVCLHYEARVPDGRLVESTYREGSPRCAALMQLPPGLREGVPYMTVGEKTRMWIPARLALMHHTGAVDDPLVYDVELLQIL
jgi:peptidylprolyl isomerase